MMVRVPSPSELGAASGGDVGKDIGVDVVKAHKSGGEAVDVVTVRHMGASFLDGCVMPARRPIDMSAMAAAAAALAGLLLVPAAALGALAVGLSWLFASLG